MYEEVYEKMKDSLLFQFHKLHSALFKVANKMIQASSVPVKIEQLPVLMCVYHYGAISQQAIADLIKRDKSSVLRTVAALEKKGLIEIIKDEQDRRKNVLKTTPTGVFLAVQIRDIMQDVENEIARVFSSKPKKEVIEILKAKVDQLNILSIS